MNKKIHLVCNAHLDPVWLWDWHDGVAETISTFRTAVEICEENENFVFNHNESILYKWIKQYEPSLFERIQTLVKAGKWHIMGGWFIQPDCNMPCGESLVRQILTGREFFKKHFESEPTTAINFDPFGHSRGLVQILARSGYDSYVICRPDDKQIKPDDFVWVGYDGSEVLVRRFNDPLLYTSERGKAKEKIEKHIDGVSDDRDCQVILWGIGNHGGGPSKLDLKQINELIEQRKDVEIKHSTPEEFFAQLQTYRESLPKVNKGLNAFAVGCYTSMVRVKQKHRLLENELYMTEKIASAAAIAGLMQYPKEDMQKALEDLLFAEFHDALPGSGVQPVEEDALVTMDHGLEILSRIKLDAYLKLTAGQEKAEDGMIPMMVYNPHPYIVKTTIECEFTLADMAREPNIYADIKVFSKGRQITCQVEKELSNSHYDWRKRVVFQAELEPFTMNRFDCETVPDAVRPRPVIGLDNDPDKICFAANDLEIVISKKSGLIESYKANGKEFSDGRFCEPVVFNDTFDSWEMVHLAFKDVAGHFELLSESEAAEFSALNGQLSPVRIIEDGPVRTVVEALFKYGDSRICQRYKLPKQGTEVEVEMRVYWLQKDQMLKLSMPTTLTDAKYYGQTAYGHEQLLENGDEVVAQKWTAAVSPKQDMAFCCINEGTYGSSFFGGNMWISLMRSPGFATLGTGLEVPIIAQDRFTPRMDQGERMFRFSLDAGNLKKMNTVDRQALVKNEKPYALVFFPSGEGLKPSVPVLLQDDVTQMPVLKKAQSGEHYIVRLFEPTGKGQETVLCLPGISKKIDLNLSGFEIKTLKVDFESGEYSEVNLMED